MLQNSRKELNSWFTTILVRKKVIILLFYYIPLEFFPDVFATVFQETRNLLHCLEPYHCIVQGTRNGTEDNLN